MSIELKLFIGLLLHFVGDYLLQTSWMANKKTTKSYVALIHALVYSLPFLLINLNWYWLIIFITHYFIDRYRLARYWIQFINRTQNLKNFGYPMETPIYLSMWLLFIVDNTFHIIINSLVIYLSN
jgi:hypothetical protein